METVLFNLLGFGVTGKTLIRAAMGIAGAVVLYLAYHAVSNHFQHIRDLEKDNAHLQEDLTYAQGQLDTAIQINRENEKTQQTKNSIAADNQATAAAERAAANARTQTYKEIHNAIDHAPPSDPRPVAPVIADTLDRLWGQQPAADPNADRHP